MGGVLLLLLAPLVMWAVAEVLEHLASTTYLWVMGEALLAEHCAGRGTKSRAGDRLAPQATTTLQA